jgi:hypothetical protein
MVAEIFPDHVCVSPADITTHVPLEPHEIIQQLYPFRFPCDVMDIAH